MQEAHENQPAASQQPQQGASQKDVSFPGNRKRKKKFNKMFLLLPIILIVIGAAGWYVFSEPKLEDEIVSTSTPTPYSQDETPTPTQEPINRDEISIQILNGTGMSGAAGDFMEQLEGLGYSEIDAGNTSSSDYETAEVTFDEGLSQSVRDEILGEMKDEYEDVDVNEDSLGDYDVEIVTGYPKGHTATATPEPEKTATPTEEPSETLTPTSSPTPTP